MTESRLVKKSVEYPLRPVDIDIAMPKLRPLHWAIEPDGPRLDWRGNGRGPSGEDQHVPLI